MKTIIALLTFGTLAAIERLRGASLRPQADDFARTLRNLALGGIIAVAGYAFLVAITVFFTKYSLGFRPEFLDGTVGLVFNLVVLDLWAYILHRAYHRVPVMWRLHSVHHLDAFLDTTSAVRFHLGEVVLSVLLRSVPIVLLDLSLETVVLFETILLCAALFHHSNIKLPVQLEAILRFVIVTPSHHWVHHHAVRADTDSNYGAVLTIWDRLFGSWSLCVRTPDMKIGVEGQAERNFLHLLTTPFKKGTTP
jgi:sterol desaturase/sphingolipid hydroxylase (fatty acid hydroxylase superfamily)